MNTLLDPLLVAIIVLTAAGILWRLQRRKKPPGCGDCGCGWGPGSTLDI